MTAPMSAQVLQGVWELAEYTRLATHKQKDDFQEEVGSQNVGSE